MKAPFIDFKSYVYDFFVRPNTRGSEDRKKRRLENLCAHGLFKGHRPFFKHNFGVQTNLDKHRTKKVTLKAFVSHIQS